jgi:hypothetical protein
MFKKIYFKLACLLVMTALSLSISGCSAVGLGVGAMIDQSKPDCKDIPSYNAGTIKKDTEITVYLRDGSQFEGKYDSLSKISPTDYAKTYAKVQMAKPCNVILPVIGDTVDVLLKRKTRHNNEFLGFDYQYKKKYSETSKMRGTECYYLYAKSFVKNQPEKFYLNNIKKIIDYNGNTNVGYVITNLMKRGEIPIMTGVNLNTATDTKNISLDRIDHFKVPNCKNAKWVGLSLGLAVDVTVIIIALKIKTEFDSKMGSINLQGW